MAVEAAVLAVAGMTYNQEIETSEMWLFLQVVLLLMDVVGMSVEQYGPSVAEQSSKKWMDRITNIKHMIKITKQMETHCKVVCQHSYVACTSACVMISQNESKSQWWFATWAPELQTDLKQCALMSWSMFCENSTRSVLWHKSILTFKIMFQGTNINKFNPWKLMTTKYTSKW